MSLAVELEDLAQRIQEYGPVALVVSVGEDGRPHVVSAQVEFAGDTVRAAVGNTTASNASARSAVTLVWPALPGSSYCLILDGSASIDTTTGSNTLVVAPTRSVLHRIAGAPESQPSCVTILDNRKG